MRRKRKAAEAAREAIRLTLKTVTMKHRKSGRKNTTACIKKVRSVIAKQDNVVITNTKPQSSQLPIQPLLKQTDGKDENGNSSLKSADDIVYEQLKKLPDKLLVQLPCGVICDAAERLKNVNYSTLAGFIIFRTDLHPLNQGYKKKIAP